MSEYGDYGFREDELHDLPELQDMLPPIEPMPVAPMQPDPLVLDPQQVEPALMMANDTPQAQESYLDFWTGAPVGADDLVVNEWLDTPAGTIQEALLTPEVPTVIPDLPLISEGHPLSTLRDIESDLQAPKDEFELREDFRPASFSDNLYPEVVDPNVSKDPPVQHVDPFVPRSVLPYEDKGWGRSLGGPVKHYEPGNEEFRRPYHTPLPKISRLSGRGFNPNRGSRRRSNNFRYEYRKDIACHACGEYKIFLDRCHNIDCGIYVVCRVCQDRTDNKGRCSNSMCVNHRHKPDEPRCEMCQEFLGEDGSSPCDACRRKYGYEPYGYVDPVG